MSSPFRFKQFSIAQNKCAMKVNTDGVLLGAWACISEASHILDIGTGTGVIALMIAQQNSTALIDAIDIDEAASIQAAENFAQSHFSNRLTIQHVALQNFYPTRLYDTIITNPPYFIDDYKTTNHRKNIAKHSIALTYTDLLKHIARLLAPAGKAWLVLPAFNYTSFITEAATHHLHLLHKTDIVAVEGKAPYLTLLCISNTQTTQTHTCNIAATITIQKENGVFTEAYKTLTKDFYLKF